MATDLQAIIHDLESCYDLRGRSLIHVGAGGGQLVGYARNARGVLGVDTDAAAVTQLAARVREAGLADRYRATQAELLARVAVMGEGAVRRVEEFRGRRDFTIAMPYRVALLRR
jgi:hypothetical protein